MQNQSPSPELFSERPVRSEFARGGVPYAVRRMVTLIVLAGFVGGTGGWFYWHAQQPTLSEAIPTIKAEGVYKQRPAQPGGLDVPHQDVELYKELENRTAPKVEPEHLLPPPETPQPVLVSSTPAPSVPAVENLIAPEPKMKIETTVTQTPASTPTSAVIQTSTPTPAPVPIIQAAPIVPTAIAPVPPTHIEPVQSAASPAAIEHGAQPVVQSKAEVVKPAAAEYVASNSAKGKTVVQLAAVTNETGAQQLMKELQNKHADSLGGVSLRVVRADLGAKGIYFRIQSPPLPPQQAERICAHIRKSNAGCLLVR